MTERVSARVLLIDEASRVLLVSSRDPDNGILVWYTPGGRVEDGEDLRTTALREIEEETGVALDDVTGPIWERHFPHTFDGRFIDGHEWFFVAHVDASQIREVAETDEGASYFEGWGWWTLEEICSFEGIFAPRRLADLLESVLAGELPSAPILTGD
jgi:8-oxo-dGTP pyrophosphatase MutT (NUDIX family)